MTRSANRKRTERLNLRVSAEQKQVIEQAAEILDTSYSAFMMQVAIDAAQRIIEESSTIRLNQEAWEKFCSALDAPAQELPGLKALFSQSGLLDWD